MQICPCLRLAIRACLIVSRGTDLAASAPDGQVQTLPRRRRAWVGIRAALLGIIVVAWPAVRVHAAPIAGVPDAAGRASQVKTVTLGQALAYAREHQPALRAAHAQVRARSEATQVTKNQWLPMFGATAQVFVGTTNNTSAMSVGSPVVALPRIGNTPATTSSDFSAAASTLAGVGLNQEVFDFGRIAAETAHADLQVEVAKWSMAASRLDVQFNVETAYFAVLAAKSVYVASQQAYQRARAHRDVAKASVEAGLRSPVDLARTDALLGQFDVGRIRAQGHVKIAQSVLAAAMGAPNEPVDTAEATPKLADMPALATAMQILSTGNPIIGGALARLEAQKEQTRAIGAQMRPNLSFNAALSGRAGGAGGARPQGDGWIPNVANWDIGIVLQWSIFDGVILAREHTSGAQVLVRKEEADAANQSQVAALQQGYIAVEIARAALPALEVSVKAARDNYAQSNAQFEAGIGNSVELADAENIRVEAEIKLALAEFEAVRARAMFGRIIAEEIYE